MIDEWGKGAKYWDHAWNPVIGCQKVSEACENCYAARMAEKFPELRDEAGGFSPHRPKTLKNPPKSGVVFAGNMTDLFGDWIEWDKQIFEMLSGLSPKATNLILTKRTNRMQAFWYGYGNQMPDDLWYGMTAENQHWLEWRYEAFCRIRGFRWLSLEPLLGSIDLNTWDIDNDRIVDGIDWVVVGAESGPNRRPCKLEWVRDIVRQCREAEVPVFVKQLDLDGRLEKDITRFPEDLQIRQVPWKKG